MVTMRRSPNVEERRRTLCDVAIELLAADGIKGLTHLKVDRRAHVADGSTSFYFRTTSALHLAVANRVAELDIKDLTAATRGHGEVAQPSGLSLLVVRALSGARLKRTKARNELALQASRDAALAEALRRFTDEFSALIRDVVQRWQPAAVRADTVLVEKQTDAVLTYIGGLMLAGASGHRRVQDPEVLDRLILSIVEGIAMSHS